MRIEPYLFFNGRCEEAMEFYKRTLGAEVEMLMRFRENPDGMAAMNLPPGSEDKVMHASFRVAGARVMCSDGMCGGGARFEGVSLSLTVGSAEEAERVYAALGEGGQEQMPLGPTFFSPRFGMVADKFGVSWMVIAEA